MSIDLQNNGMNEGNTPRAIFCFSYKQVEDLRMWTAMKKKDKPTIYLYIQIHFMSRSSLWSAWSAWNS